MPVAGGPFIQKTGILLEVDSADKTSYSGTGTTWINQVRPGTNNGTLNNISFDSADAKGALVFTGSNTFVDFGNLGPSLTSSFSFQVAFEPAATASGQPYTILSYASASSTSSITFKLDYTSSNQTVVLTTFSNTGSQNIVYAMSASVASGSWNIVHGTFGSTLAALYVNGLGQAYAPTTGSVVGYNTSNRLYAGLNFGSTSGYYTGSIGNIIVNNADLGGLDINRNYNAIASRFSLPVRRPTITDADAFAFVEAAGINNSTQQSAINTLVLGLKSNNLWNKMLAIYPLIGGTAYSHKFNLKNVSLYNVNWFGAITHNSNGSTFTNGYGACTVAPSNTGDLNSFHMSVYTRNTGSGTFGYIGGVNRGGQPPNTEMNWFGNSGYHHINSGNVAAVALNNTTGSLVLSRISSTNVSGYNNGGLTIATSVSSTIISPQQIILNSNGDASNINLAFATIGYTVTTADAANLHTLVQAYQTTLGRNV
jgi:hypothetical protein